MAFPQARAMALSGANPLREAEIAQRFHQVKSRGLVQADAAADLDQRGHAVLGDHLQDRVGSGQRLNSVHASGHAILTAYRYITPNRR